MSYIYSFWAALILIPAGLAVVLLLSSQAKRSDAIAIAVTSFFAILFLGGIYAWSEFLQHHSISEFDQLGNLTREFDSGFSLLIPSWPLWIPPVCLIGTLMLVIGFYVGKHIKKNKVNTNPNNGINKLEYFYIKQELIQTQQKLGEAITFAEELAKKNLDLEILIDLLQKTYKK